MGEILMSAGATMAMIPPFNRTHEKSAQTTFTRDLEPAVIEVNSLSEIERALRAPKGHVVVPPLTSALPTLMPPEYRKTLERVRALISEEDEADQPSLEAYDRTLALIRDAAQHLGGWFPGAIAASTGPGRSLRVLWSRNRKEVRLVLGGSTSNRSYIYRREGDRSAVDETLSGDCLAQYLVWMNQDS